MKFILFSLVLMAAVMLWSGCKGSKYSAEKLPEQQLRWGTGGGFVGKESAYILCDNGQIFSRDIMGVTKSAGKAKGKVAKAHFKTVETLQISKIDFTHPGNTYSFLEWQDGDMVRRIVWGDKAFPVEKSVEELYGALNGLLKK